MWIVIRDYSSEAKQAGAVNQGRIKTQHQEHLI